MSFNAWFKENKDEGSGKDIEAAMAQSAKVEKPFWSSVFSRQEEPQPEPERQTLLSGLFGSQSSPESTQSSCIPSMSASDRYKGFGILAAISALFFALAFFVCLPMALFAPSKFASAFTLGSLCFMAAFAVLEGPALHLSRTCSKERLPFTVVYFLSIALTLYSCFHLKSYIAIVASAGVQVAALLWYGATYIPGGTASLNFLASMLFQGLKAAVMPCCKMIRGA